MLSGEVAMVYSNSSGVVLGLSELRMCLASASGLRVTLRLIEGFLLFLLLSPEDEEEVLPALEDLLANLSTKRMRPMRRPMPPRIAREAMILLLVLDLNNGEREFLPNTKLEEQCTSEYRSGSWSQ